jgi:uncharacterized protein (DUF433 family)/DNA-binding transcriptional MerR regulator
VERKSGVEYLGHGIYTYKEASLITGVRVQTIRRWIEGYKNSNSKRTEQKPPLFPSDYSKIGEVKALSFMDIIEILFIKAFQKYGLSTQRIRKAVERASVLLSSPHPFAEKVFYTDGKTILARIAEESDMPDLIDLINKQYQFDPIVLPELYKCIDFNDYDIAERYWPEGRNVDIVIDPKINFGKPSIFGPNIPIYTLYDLYKKGQSIEELAGWYDVDEKVVASALKYEDKKVA